VERRKEEFMAKAGKEEFMAKAGKEDS